MSINPSSIDTSAGYVGGIDSFQDCAIFPAMKPPTFHPIPPDQLPRDDARQTGKDLTFRTLEHDQFDAPHAIEVTDKEGRSAVYVLMEVDGVVGRYVSRST